MLFSSPIFFVFFLVYFLFHLFTPARFRVYLIIVGSAVFYAWWKVDYLWLPFLLMLIAYGGVAFIERAATPQGRKGRLIATLIALFAPLIFFKYTDFFYRDVLGPIFGWDGKLVDLALPLGVSFITFTLTAFVVDTYRGRFPPGQRFSSVLAYVLFFPHLIAGPILRPVELIPQIDHPTRAKLVRLAVPITIFSLGLAKKLIFADQIAPTVDAVYSGGTLSAPTALLAIYGFAVQIYCDFSGYTDMAIGLALMLGVRLPNNFLRPYAASSLVDFWRRWHITLSHWLRDYLYIPLGGSRHGRARQIGSLLVTMILGGLWHGANWTFFIWGAIHGFGLAAIHMTRAVPGLAFLRAVPRWLGILLTFHFVAFAWVLFRAPNLARAGEILAAPFRGSWDDIAGVLDKNIFVLLLVAVFFVAHRWDDHRRVKLMVRRLRPEMLWPILLLVWVLAITLSQGGSAKFIYFDF